MAPHTSRDVLGQMDERVEVLVRTLRGVSPAEGTAVASGFVGAGQ